MNPDNEKYIRKGSDQLTYFEETTIDPTTGTQRVIQKYPGGIERIFDYPPLKGARDIDRRWDFEKSPPELVEENITISALASNGVDYNIYFGGGEGSSMDEDTVEILYGPLLEDPQLTEAKKM